MVVAVDHIVRGIFYPQSVFNVLTRDNWRWLEHVFWVVFENVFLIQSCVKGSREMKVIATRQAELESTNEIIEAKVRAQTASLDQAKQDAESANEAKSGFFSPR